MDDENLRGEDRSDKRKIFSNSGGRYVRGAKRGSKGSFLELEIKILGSMLLSTASQASDCTFGAPTHLTLPLLEFLLQRSLFPIKLTVLDLQLGVPHNRRLSLPYEG